MAARRNSRFIGITLVALAHAISSRHTAGPELTRGSLLTRPPLKISVRIAHSAPTYSKILFNPNVSSRNAMIAPGSLLPMRICD